MHGAEAMFSQEAELLACPLGLLQEDGLESKCM